MTNQVGAELMASALPQRVLVVDDDRGVRDLLTYMLADLGYETICAQNGQEALELLRHAVAAGCPPDVILLDLDMPVMDGREFRLRQKADPLLAPIHVVAISSDWEARVDSHATLRKPINLDTLVSTLHQLH